MQEEQQLIEEIEASGDIEIKSSDIVYRLRYETMRYEFISPSITQLLGYSREELAHMNMRSLISETRMLDGEMRRVECYTSLEQTRKLRRIRDWQAMYHIRAKNAQMLWIADQSYPWFDKDGAIIGSIGVLSDVTDLMDALPAMNAQYAQAAELQPV